MKPTLSSLAMICLLLTAGGCGKRSGTTGSGVIATEERDLSDFEFVQLVGDGMIDIKIGPSAKARLTLDDNLLTNITTRIEGPLLIIRPTGGISSGNRLQVELTTPSLSGVALEGGGLLSTGPFNSATFLIRITGAGKIVTRGTTESLEIKISGGGEIDATRLLARDVNITIVGSGKVDLHATNQVAAKITGTGQIRYSGNPQEVHRSISGDGSIAAR